MSSEQINVNLQTGLGNAELVIRHGEALLEIKPMPLKIEGQIGAPAEYLAKRAAFIDKQTSHVLINEVAGSITLVLNDNTELRSEVVGVMNLNPDFRLFKINHGEWESPKALGEHLRKNRTYFDDDKEKFVKLVDSLTNFKARVEKELESSNDNRGNKREMAEQKVSTAIPEKFTMSIPLHSGSDKSRFEVEIYFDIRDAGCKVTLQSIEAEELRRAEVEEAITAQLLAFAEIVTIYK